jgi:Ca2+-binding EF-hand superfamily protein
MNVYFRLGMVAALAGCVALSAGAADSAKAADGPAKGSLLERADTNQDGKLSPEEVKEQLPRLPERRFKALDKDKDGFLTPEELRSGREGAAPAPDRARMEQRLRKADTDGDKAVSKDEYTKAIPKAPKQAFDRLDTNKDGKLTPEDKPAGGAQGRDAMMQRMRTADKDKDGGVSEEEFKAAFPKAPAERFKQLDRNKDGKLTPADREDAAKAGAGKSQGGGAGLRHLLEEADADSNGSLSYEEVTAKKPGFPKEQFERMDRNKDGKLSKADTRQGDAAKKKAGKAEVAKDSKKTEAAAETTN